ncbi:hypothetical protein E2C01_018742 [Portunus trituberculatus]|uniref:Uncharacterized protein n=1 Tax=Portunus trituberculatus TaxID=210409 RepID=A0A5B7DVC0_PORTR|nr:hypothetical protein [Portunus trituberculatus]
MIYYNGLERSEYTLLLSYPKRSRFVDERRLASPWWSRCESVSRWRVAETELAAASLGNFSATDHAQTLLVNPLQGMFYPQSRAIHRHRPSPPQDSVRAGQARSVREKSAGVIPASCSSRQRVVWRQLTRDSFIVQDDLSRLRE